MKKLILIAIAAAGLVGCASVPMGDAQADAAAKKFAPQSNKAGIYIYRNESMGGAVTMDVEVDGKPVGQTASKTYLYTQVAPGRHTITSKAENTDSLTIDAKPATITDGAASKVVTHYCANASPVRKQPRTPSSSDRMGPNQVRKARFSSRRRAEPAGIAAMDSR